ncbi:MAG: cystathionine gamma-synthase [Actinomycetota bacterium]|nr:cystathionine gamma-synthase [Actinomycetota bacterium]
MTPDTTPGFATRAIHAGQEPDKTTGAVIPAIHMSTTFRQDGVGVLPGGFEYSRSGNPTRAALEECLAALEGVDLGGDPLPNVRALCFASGLAASDALFRSVLSPGDHVVIPDDAYGGTYRLVNSVLGDWGVTHTVAPVSDPGAFAAAAIPGRTKLMWVESPTNPMLGVADLSALADIAHAAEAHLVVDNTFATPYLQQPMAWGADVVVHSVTKYLGGHSDVVSGAVIARDPQLVERIAFHQNAMGAVPSPFDCWLTLRGIRTLAVRMERHCTNARAVVEALMAHPEVLEVFYPGLPGNQGHASALRQMRDFGGMVSFRVAGGSDRARAVCAGTELFTLGESLGGVESLIELPAAMTHSSVADSELAVPDDLIRLSVGIEDAADLVADLVGALSA